MKPFSVTTSVASAFENINRAPAAPAVGVIASIGIGVCGGCGTRASGNFAGAVDPEELAAGGLDPEVLWALAGVFTTLIVVSLVFQFVMWIARTWLLAGQLRVHREVLTGGPGDPKTNFSGGDVFLSMLGAGLLVHAINGVTFLVLGAPSAPFFWWAYEAYAGWDVQQGHLWSLAGLLVLGIITVPLGTYVWAGVRLVQHAVALDGLGVMEALEHSWQLAAGNRVRMLNFAVLTWMIEVSGVAICCVGQVYTQLLAATAWTDAYLRATGKISDTPAA